MRLWNKLSSIPRNDVVAELDQMLDHAHVSVNWYGQRTVSVDGYKDCVEINEFAIKYLSASPFKSNSNSTLQERLDCYALWGRVQKLYIDSNEELKQTSLYQYLTPIRV